MSIKVVRAGLLTLIQDKGRYGYQKHGVIVSGAMDLFAHRLANILIGNQEEDATVEMNLLGPTFQMEEDKLISICGGDVEPTIDGKEVPMWRPILVRRGSIIQCKRVVSGYRAYMAVSGGISVPNVLGSKSTYLRAGIGGFEGRSLRDGDRLETGVLSKMSTRLLRTLMMRNISLPFSISNWTISYDLLPAYSSHPVVRVIRGRHFENFSFESQRQFFRCSFKVTLQSDRMGYRVKGPTLQWEGKSNLLSEAVSIGTIQVPSDGNPILLMADRQTTGGYPKIASIISVDLPIVAQVRPLEMIRFQEVTLEEAEALFMKREKDIQMLKHGILDKQRGGSE